MPTSSRRFVILAAKYLDCLSSSFVLLPERFTGTSLILWCHTLQLNSPDLCHARSILNQELLGRHLILKYILHMMLS
nr:AlNc14C125G6807 [Albugo laibachii Nc14]|eukprot:CCA21539.1 AlNc14C125G6807 [Albugo laibachii Nc14]